VTRHDVLNQLMALKAYGCLAKECSVIPCSGISRESRRTLSNVLSGSPVHERIPGIGIETPAWQNGADCIDLALRGLDLAGRNVDVTDLGEVEVFADPLLHKVFFNLIENSLRYGGRR